MDFESLPVNYENWLKYWMPWIRLNLGLVDDDEKIITELIELGIDNRSEINSESIISGSKAIIFGAGPVLTDHIDLIKKIPSDISIIAADGATIELKDNGIIPHLVLTDLDGIDSHMIEELDRTTFIVLAHGDNKSSISELLSYFVNIPENLIWATQGKKLGKWCNTLGFTDGDRALCTVKNYDHVLLLGFDFKSGLIGRASKPFYKEHKPLTEIKFKKLKIAHRIIKWISNQTIVYTLDKSICPGSEIEINEFFKL